MCKSVQLYVLQPQILDFSSETISNSSKIRPVPREFEEDHDMIDQSAGINDYGYEFFYGKIQNKYHRKSFQKEQRLYNGQFSLPTEWNSHKLFVIQR